MKDAIRKIVTMMHQAVPDVNFEIRFWDDDRIRIGEPPQVILWFKTRTAVSRTIGDGFLGFGEAYMAGDIDVEGDFQLLFRLAFSINFDENPMSLWEKLRFFLLSLLHQNTIRRSPKNIAHHYDLGNDFYHLLLGQTMTYTCAYFKSPDDDLEQAQLNKYEHVCRKLLLSQNESLIDLGCGWGGLLIYAAQNYGITGIGVTISTPQCDYANQRIAELGLQDRIKVILQDYREARGTFDKIASIGMFEHVGKRYIPVCIKKISTLLKPGGLGLIHTMGNDTPYPDDPWTLKYMFPGYHVPVLEHLIRELAKNRCSILDVENLRMHYARTTERWLENFERHSEQIRQMYDETFVRQWRLFLHLAPSSFKYAGNRLFQILFSNGLNNELPITRSHLYHE